MGAPHWTPDGRALIFAERIARSDAQLSPSSCCSVVTLRLQLDTNEVQVSVHTPHWSPDGQHYFALEGVGEQGDRMAWRLYRADGTRPEDGPDWYPDPPIWMPDSQGFLVGSWLYDLDGNRRQIFMAEGAGNTWSQIRPASLLSSDARWLIVATGRMQVTVFELNGQRHATFPARTLGGWRPMPLRVPDS